MTFFGDRSPEAYADAILWGTVEGIGFFGVSKIASKGFKIAKTAYLKRQITNTFKIVGNRGGSSIPGFNYLTTQMSIQTRAGTFAISSGMKNDSVTGALKHIVNEVMTKSGKAATTEMAEAIVIKEIKAIIEAVAMDGSGGWSRTGGECAPRHHRLVCACR